jgi:hypothetical protein
VDILAVAEYIARSPPPEGTTLQNGGSIEGTHLSAIADIEHLTLGLVAHSFSSLAEQARVNQWVVFRDEHDEVLDKQFHKQGKYNSSFIYEYLKKNRELTSTTANQKKSTVHHRLNPAQKVVQEKSLPQLSVDQVHTLLLAGQTSRRRREM